MSVFSQFPEEVFIRYRVRGKKRFSPWEKFGSVHIAELLFGACASPPSYRAVSWLVDSERGLIVRLHFTRDVSEREIVDWNAHFAEPLPWELFVRQHCPQASPKHHPFP